MADSIPGGTRIVGKGIPKGDAKFKASGAARYAADILPPEHGLLCGKILRSPFAHATIVSIDTTQAAALKGVHAVVTGNDVAPVRIGRWLRDRTVLAQGKVRCIGEPVAAVAAVDQETAIEALSLIRVEYQPLPAVFCTDDALAPDAPIIHESLVNYEDPQPSQRGGNQRNLVTIEHGDVDAAFTKADILVEGAFTTQVVHHGFIEPKACVASLDKSGKVTVWASTKGPFLCRSTISRALGLPLSKVRVIAPTLGGDFGGKGAPTIEPICVLLALRAGRPVKISLSAQEELATNFVRHPAVIDLKLAASKDGEILGIQGEVTYNCGAYSDCIFGLANSCSFLQGPYNVPAVRLRGRSIFTNSVPAGQVRAPGAPQTLFAIESLVDDLARRLGLDPFEIRRRNALQDGDVAPGGKGVMDNVGLGETIEKTAEHVSLHMPKRNTNQGVGVACGAWHMTPMFDPSPTKCIVKLNEDGSAVLLTGLSDNGAGHHVVLAQVVGEVLGLELDEVTVVGGDTELTPFDSGPGGSFATTRVANLARFAAEDARQQVFALAASRLEANAEDLELAERQVYVRGAPDRALSLVALASGALASPRGAIIGTGSAEREEWFARKSAHASTVGDGTFCTHAARVEVDADTGYVTVLDYAVAQDVGRALNPLNALGQIHGAVVAGLGYALTEDLIVQDGRVVNPGYADYHLPAADITPLVHTIVVERPSTFGPFGAKGIGETSITPVAAAIANAVYDAVGVRIRDLPITPEKVLRALKAKG